MQSTPASGSAPTEIVPPELEDDPKFSRSELRTAATSSWLGTALEYMDFTLFTLATALVFGPLFFPNQEPAVGLIYSVAIYGSGFLARPFGGWVFGRIGDRMGRKIVLVVTLVMMGVATFAIGLLPTYEQVGILAPVLLTIVRLTQGLAAGAELSGASLILVEGCPDNQRGFWGSIVALGATTGVFFATVLWLALSTTMERSEFLDWGWRVPFLLSIVTAAVGLYVRRAVRESPVFAQRRALIEARRAQAANDSLGKDALRAQKAFWVSMGIRICENGAVYLVNTALVGWAATTVGINPTYPTVGILLGSVIGFFTVPLVGWLSDKMGRRRLFLVLVAMHMVWTVIAVFMILSGEPGLVIAAFAVFFSLTIGPMYSVESSWLVEMFGSRQRYTFMTTAKEVGSVVAGGLGPLIVTILASIIGKSWVPVVAVMTLYSIVGLIGAWLAPETKGRDLSDEADAL